jgi:hypothetical protein
LVLLNTKKIDLIFKLIFFITSDPKNAPTMDTCGICLETLDDPISFQCDHSFHNKCISQWLFQKNTCPLCRHEIYDTHDDEDEEISYDITLNERVITLEYSLITKMTHRIADLTEYIDSDSEIPLKYMWEMDENGSLFNIINTKKYRCTFKYDLFESDNTILISVDIEIIYKLYTGPQRLLNHRYEKWRARPQINKTKTKSKTKSKSKSIYL